MPNFQHVFYCYDKYLCHTLRCVFIFTTALLALTLSGISFAKNSYAKNDKQSHEVLTLTKAIRIAQQQDPWLVGNRYQEAALTAQSIAANTLPDPKVSLGLANLATDSLAFDQEAMTQFKLGVSQVFPRGESLALRQQQLNKQSQQYPYLRENRRLNTALAVGKLWLGAYKVQQSIALIEQNRSLFEQLADVAQVGYSSTVGKTRQQDVVQAQLELTRLDDRLNQLMLKKRQLEGQLIKWLIKEHTNASSHESAQTATEFSKIQDLDFGNELPEISWTSEVSQSTQPQSWQALAPLLKNHPSIKALEKSISASKIGIRLAEQKYQPQWGVSASYGYRDSDPYGNDRSDLFSVGVTFDVPLFTSNRQDQQVKSAVAQSEAIKTEKRILLRELFGRYVEAYGQLQQLRNRKTLFKNQLLPQIHDQAESSLTAYTHDDGSFSAVVRARISELNVQIDYLALNVEQQKIHLILNYIFAGAQQ